MEDKYPKAYKEVLEILKYMPQESVKKIPESIIDTFREKMDKDYNFKIDTSKGFEEQEILDETKAILANIFRDYWATPYQKERIEAKERYDRQKSEREKREKYNPDKIFEKTHYEEENNSYQEKNSENLPVEKKKDTFFQKVIDFFKKLFVKK